MLPDRSNLSHTAVLIPISSNHDQQRRISGSRPRRSWLSCMIGNYFLSSSQILKPIVLPSRLPGPHMPRLMYIKPGVCQTPWFRGNAGLMATRCHKVGLGSGIQCLLLQVGKILSLTLVNPFQLYATTLFFLPSRGPFLGPSWSIFSSHIYSWSTSIFS